MRVDRAANQLHGFPINVFKAVKKIILKLSLDEFLKSWHNCSCKSRCFVAGYAWAEDKEHCEEYGRMLQADPAKVSARAKKRGLPQVHCNT